MYQRFGKRIFDIFCSGLLFVVMLPLWGMVAFLVRVKLGAPIFFRQERPGLYGRKFTILKFRTMTGTRDGQGTLLPDSERLTKFGKFLRSTSLDELPELVNVLKGEMSLVGPRPLLMHYLPLYSQKQMRRHEVRPGITGWAQVNGRNAISWQKKFEMDIWYIDHYSFWLDLKVLVMTVVTSLKREAITAPGEATIREFVGNLEG